MFAGVSAMYTRQLCSAVCVCRHEDAVRALEASHDKRFFGSTVTVSVHDGVGKIIIFIIIISIMPDVLV